MMINSRRLFTARAPHPENYDSAVHWTPGEGHIQPPLSGRTTLLMRSICLNTRHARLHNAQNYAAEGRA